MNYYGIPYSAYLVIEKLQFLLGKLNYLRAYYWNVSIGKNVRFIGKLYFRKFPKSIISIGNNCVFRSKKCSNLIGINRPCIISTNGPSKDVSIKIGDNCGFSGTIIGAYKSIIIGKNVKCGANTLITDADWHLDDYRSGDPKPVVIKDNVWLGVNSVILKGVVIGENTVIGANSVVSSSIPANVVAAGNPCRVIKKII